MRVKIEINTREHFTCRGLRSVTFSVDTLWLSASAPVTSYEIEELLATKLRALYQRKKGRDLYDLSAALAVLDIDAAGIVECFRHYMASEGAAVTRAMFEANLAEKLASPAFRSDVLPMLRADDAYDVDAAGALVSERLISRLSGEPWRGRSTGEARERR